MAAILRSTIEHLRVIYFLYRCFQIVGLPFMVLYFAVRGLRDPRYWGGFTERLGFLPSGFRQPAPGAVWLHAVSVGEVLSSAELARRLRAEHPGVPLFISTATVAGRAVAEQKLAGVADGVFYAPVDYCFAVRRVLRALRPRVLVVLETELWPNLYREARRTGCRLALVNGRISDRAWPRYSRVRWFFRPVLQLPDTILAQNEISRRRFEQLGAPPDRVRIAGNLKYDFDPQRVQAPEAVRGFLDRVRPKEVWIAASTMPPAEAGDPDEDEVVLAAFRALAPEHPGLLLVLVPRRPERFDTAARLLENAGVPFVRRSRLEETRLALPGVLLLDSMGELGGLFRFADVVFMGGTLARRGGHNILEPAFFGRPVVIGPHMENFPDIAGKFLAGGAVVSIGGAEELRGAVDALLRDAALRSRVGEKAQTLARSEQGAAARVLAEIETQLAEAVPRYRPSTPALALLWPLSRLWLLGGRVKRRIDLARQRRLGTPVISVGGLAAGGTGKSPLVLWLAQQLRAAGYRPAILTRGYRRRVPEKDTILEPGARAAVAHTGDEPQAYVRAAVGPVGIGADRYSTGRLVEERFHPDVFLLDDGFQHARLHRSLDLVAIDALDPFAGGAALPLGRLRESPRALARAGTVVITRCPPDVAAIERAIREHNPTVPVFQARVRAEAWVDAATGEEWTPSALPFRTAAFCGLGNPASFWQSLAEAGCRPLFRAAFPDHHAYRPGELRDLAARARTAGVEALLATEKDVMNLCDGWPALLAPLRICWLRIGLEVDGAEGLLHLVRKHVRA